MNRDGDADGDGGLTKRSDGSAFSVAGLSVESYIRASPW